MKRKISSLLMIVLVLLCLTSCGGKKKLLFLNWGEYIDESLIEAFEKKYNCTVSMDLGESNEIFYSKVRGGTTVYDVVCPSDYMIEKMYANDMLQQIDFSKLTISKYNPDSDNVMPGVKNIYSDMDKNLKDKLGDKYQSGEIKKYAVPYLWGTWGIMYSTRKEGLEDAVKNKDNQWTSLFDRSKMPNNTKVAMYDSHQHAYYAACKYLGFNNYKELPLSDLNTIKSLIEKMNYDAWGTDNIKKDIVAGNIDVGFMWTGDFLYYYCEQAAKTIMNAYLAKDVEFDEIKNMIDVLTDSSQRVYKTKNKSYEIGFDLFIPDDTIAFCDNLAITKDSENTELAYKFIDFMTSNSVSRNLDENGNEPSNISDDDLLQPSFSNTYYVCYDAVEVNVYNEITSLADFEFTNDVLKQFNLEVESGTDPYDTTLYNILYDYVTGIAFTKYYPKDTIKGSILAAFPRAYVNTINTVFNNARA